jgi:hypothetical protein
MKFDFKLWLEADEDFQWFVAGRGNKKIKDIIQNKPMWDFCRNAARAALVSIDPTINNLKADSLNMLVNYIAFSPYSIYVAPGLENDEKNQEIEVNTWLKTKFPRNYGVYQNLVHANFNNVKFFQSLQYVDEEGNPAVTSVMLRNDSQKLQQQAKSTKSSRQGPDGRTILEFKDGFKWVSLDRAFCDKEGAAGNHCGNALGQHEGFKDDVILSLRDPNNNVEATFVVNNGHLGESKGPGNTKIDPKYYPYIANLFLANGPSPLPIKTNFYHYDDSNDSRRPQYMPEKDTTVLDLIGSNTIDDKTIELLINKFEPELKNTRITDEYLTNEMSDEHRKKVIKTLDKVWGINSLDSELKREFENTKKWAHHKSLRTWDFFTIPEDEIVNYREHKTDIIQIIDYNTKQFEKMLNGNWKTHIDIVSQHNTGDPGLPIRETLKYLYQEIHNLQPHLFMFNFNSDIARQKQDRFKNFPDRRDPDHQDNPLAYHPPLAHDNPDRREIKKAMTKEFKTILKWMNEIEDFMESFSPKTNKDPDDNKMMAYLLPAKRDIENIKYSVEMYLKRVT